MGESGWVVFGLNSLGTVAAVAFFIGGLSARVKKGFEATQASQNAIAGHLRGLISAAESRADRRDTEVNGQVAGLWDQKVSGTTCDATHKGLTAVMDAHQAEVIRRLETLETLTRNGVKNP